MYVQRGGQQILSSDNQIYHKMLQIVVTTLLVVC